MIAVFLTTLIGGLMLGVRVMLYGVERPREFGDLSARSFRLSPAVVAAVDVPQVAVVAVAALPAGVAAEDVPQVAVVAVAAPRVDAQAADC